MRICASTTCVFCSGNLDSSSAYGEAITYSGEKVSPRINLQRGSGHAKPYQVRQVRRVILQYGLEVNG